MIHPHIFIKGTFNVVHDNFGDMEINHSCSEIGVAEKLLDNGKGDSRFHEVRGKGVALMPNSA
jgi:hypothetical protein